MAGAMQVTGSFLGSRTAFAPRANLSRPRICFTVRAEKAASAGTWLPGIDSPSWLEEANLPANRGFDILNFGTDKNRLAWYAEAEKTNGRWAMAAVAGILGQELLGVQPRWFEAGAKEYAFPLTTLTALEFLIIGPLELKRYQGWKETGTSGFLNYFPFDPLKLNSDANEVKEIKNGRLAMVAIVGFAVQALVTRKGPIENLTDHLSDPLSNNFISSIANLPQTLGAGVAASAPSAPSAPPAPPA